MRKRLAILEIYHFYSLAMTLLLVCLLTNESLITTLLEITLTAIRAFTALSYFKLTKGPRWRGSRQAL